MTTAEDWSGASTCCVAHNLVHPAVFKSLFFFCLSVVENGLVTSCFLVFSLSPFLSLSLYIVQPGNLLKPGVEWTLHDFLSFLEVFVRSENVVVALPLECTLGGSSVLCAPSLLPWPRALKLPVSITSDPPSPAWPNTFTNPNPPPHPV